MRRFYPFLILALILLAYSQRIRAYDAWRLYNYQAPTAIAQLAADDTMTAKAQHLFYINHPVLLSGQAFNQPCPNNGGEKTIVLGCYHPNELGIYLFRVMDPQLNGVEQVTAAHEMLHAAYQRLNSGQKTSVEALLQAQFKAITDQRILDEIATYQRTEPTAVVDEMHSVFGTELSNLSPALQTYYAQYFTDQSKIPGFASQYQSAFTSRKQAVANYDTQLAALKATIQANENQLDSQKNSLDNRRSQISDQNSVDSFNADVKAYNDLLSQTQSAIAQYNQLVDQRNAVAVQEQNLAQELNSNLQTQSAQ